MPKKALNPNFFLPILALLVTALLFGVPVSAKVALGGSGFKNENALEKSIAKELIALGKIALPTAEGHRRNAKTKTLATLGEGNVSIRDDEASGENSLDRLNRDLNKTEKELFSTNTGMSVEATIDTRLFTEDGRKQIKEDIKRTELLIDAIGDVATEDSVQLQDLRKHIGDLQRELDVQETLAREDGGKHAQALNDPNATPEQKQAALNAYAETYADIFAIDIEAARVIAVNTVNQNGETVAGLHYTQDGKSVIVINDNAQDNGLTYANTIGHEVTHAQIAQGGSRDRGENLNEDYSTLRGDYSEELYGFSFSQNDLGNLNTGISNQHAGNASSELIKNNHEKIVRDNPQKVDYLKVMSRDITKALTVPNDERYYLENNSTLSKLAEAAGLNVEWNALQGRHYLESDQVQALQAIIQNGLGLTNQEGQVFRPTQSALYYAVEGETPEMREQQVRTLLGGPGGTHIPEDVYQAALEKVQNAEIGETIDLSSERTWAKILTEQNADNIWTDIADKEDTFLANMLDDMVRSYNVATDAKAPRDMNNDAAIDTIINVAPIPAVKGVQVGNQVIKHGDEVLAIVDDVVEAGVKTSDDVAEGVVKANTESWKYENRLDVTQRTADDVNTEFPGNYRPPYEPGTQVTEYTTKESDQFVRVHGPEGNVNTNNTSRNITQGEADDFYNGVTQGNTGPLIDYQKLSTQTNVSPQVLENVVQTPKGQRPNPSTYLSQSQIDEHLSVFEGGVTKFVTKTNYDKYGIAQRDGTSFVLPKTEADALLKSTGGNPRALEEALGLPENFLDGNTLMRVDVAKPKELNLRVPSGNEAGANDLWLPGGKLPNGNREAIIDAEGIKPENLSVKDLIFEK